MLKRAILLTPLLLAMGLSASTASGAETPSRKIVVFREGADEFTKEGSVRQVGGNPVKSLRLVNGMVAELTPSSAAALSRRGNVVRVEDDFRAHAAVVAPPAPVRPGSGGLGEATESGPGAGVPAPPQTVPWGISRINAPQAWSVPRRAAVKVAVIDTGISTSHPDLRVAGGVNMVTPNGSYDDDNGHGSHVAGIIAALDNSFGVVGADPNLRLYAVKVLDSFGGGWTSDIIAGLDWSVANGIQVVNMSLGMSLDAPALHEAIVRAHAAGVTLVAAAGNSGPASDSVAFPAAYPEVLAVAAINSNNVVAPFSSRGTQVDLAAPGVNVLSTFRGSAYASLSGTSMAAPHVTAVAALRLAFDPERSPDHVASVLMANANSLPGLTADQQGAGLVDAFLVATAP